jgi:hypothetical protein
MVKLEDTVKEWLKQGSEHVKEQETGENSKEHENPL